MTKSHIAVNSVNKKPIVQKYGGATLATPEKIKSVAERIARLAKTGTPVVVVASAMGQTTNDLIALAHQVSQRPTWREMDMLLTTGERISTALLSMALNDLGVPALSLTGSQAGIITDDSHFNAQIIDVRAHRVQENLHAGKVVVLAGFQGVSAQTKEITTLGRGGSDTSAIAMAHFLQADHCEILKDVSSVFSADPKIISNARELPELSYEELYEMTWWGAKVLHYRSVEMAKKFNVPLYVGPAAHENTGTWVRRHWSPTASVKILALNSHSKVLKIKISSREKFSDRLHELQIPTPAILDDVPGHELWVCGDDEILETLRQEFGANSEIFSSVTLTANNHWTDSLRQSTLQILLEADVKTHKTMTNDLSFTLIIDPEKRILALQKLHGLI